MFTQEEKEMYSRQVLLDSFGETGQKKLKQASVLVVGAGGLGCPALMYLAAAGVGHLGIVDHDRVELTNLHRQLLYTPADIGLKKVKAAAIRLLAINPWMKISEYDTRLQSINALDFLRPFDIIIDGTDNFSARYLINDACALLKKPWVYGSVYKFEGQLSVFNALLPDGSRGPDYRCMFPVPPPADSVSACHESGVLGVIPGTIGMLQATETIKLLSGCGDILSGKLLTFDARRMTFETLAISRPPDFISKGPQTEAEFMQMDEKEFCSGITEQVNELEPEELEKLLLQEDILLVDIREEGEYTTVNGIKTVRHPLSAIDKFDLKADDDRLTVFLCQRGIRSKIFIHKLTERAISGKFFSLKSGVDGWNQFKSGSEKLHNQTD